MLLPPSTDHSLTTGGGAAGTSGRRSKEDRESLQGRRRLGPVRDFVCLQLVGHLTCYQGVLKGEDDIGYVNACTIDLELINLMDLMELCEHMYRVQY